MSPICWVNILHEMSCTVLHCVSESVLPWGHRWAKIRVPVDAVVVVERRTAGSIVWLPSFAVVLKLLLVQGRRGARRQVRNDRVARATSTKGNTIKECNVGTIKRHNMLHHNQKHSKWNVAYFSAGKKRSPKMSSLSPSLVGPSDVSEPWVLSTALSLSESLSLPSSSSTSLENSGLLGKASG